MPLPDLDVDVQAREISFDWKEMYQLFFTEEQRLDIELRDHPVLPPFV